MIATTPESKPIEVTPAEEQLAEAYAIVRQTKFYFGQLEPSLSLAADLKAAARDFCLAYEQRRGAAEPSPALLPVTDAPPETLRDVLFQAPINGASAPHSRPLIPTTEF